MSYPTTPTPVTDSQVAQALARVPQQLESTRWSLKDLVSHRNLLVASHEAGNPSAALVEVCERDIESLFRSVVRPFVSSFSFLCSDDSR